MISYNRLYPYVMNEMAVNILSWQVTFCRCWVDCEACSWSIGQCKCTQHPLISLRRKRLPPQSTAADAGGYTAAGFSQQCGIRLPPMQGQSWQNTTFWSWHRNYSFRLQVWGGVFLFFALLFFFSFCRLKNTSIMSYSWHILSVTKQGETRVWFWEHKKLMFLKVSVTSHFGFVLLVHVDQVFASKWLEDL